MTGVITWETSFNGGIETAFRPELVTGMKRGDPCPLNALFGGSLFAHRVGVRTRVGNFLQYTIYYVGLSEEYGDYSEYRVEWTANTQTSPIETHEDFVSSIGGTVASPKNSAVFDTDTGEFIGFPADAPKKLGGVTDYLDPNITLRMSWVETYGRTNPAYWLSRIRQQVNIPSEAQVVYAFEDSRNFLLNGVSLTYYASGKGSAPKWTEWSLDFLLSGAGGWNDEIYEKG